MFVKYVLLSIVPSPLRNSVDNPPDLIIVGAISVPDIVPPDFAKYVVPAVSVVRYVEVSTVPFAFKNSVDKP